MTAAADRATSLSPGMQAAQASRRRRRWQPANLVIAIAIVLVVIVFGALAWLAWVSFGTTLTQAQTRARAGATLFSEEAAGLMSSALLALQQVAEEVAEGSDVASVPANPALATVRQRLNGMQLSLYDAAGHPVATTPAPGSGPDISAADYFTALREGGEWIIAPDTSVKDGESSFLVAQRLSRGGTFQGVAVAHIDPAVLERIWTSLALGADSTISLVRDDGLVVARHPGLGAPLNIHDLPVFQTLQSAPSGSYESPRSPVDGVARIVAFERVANYGEVAIVGVSEDLAVRNLWSAIRIVLYLLGPIALLLLAGSFLTASLLRRSARSQESLEAALAHNDVLIREIHHRVKNNLQSVNALLQMQAIPRNVKTEMGQRIAAMSAVHEHIYRSSNFNRVAAKPYLETLINSLSGTSDPQVKLVAKLDDLFIDKDAATPFGLIANEVVSNAYKHAFPEGRKGTIVVELSRTADRRGRLVVTDDGIGLDPAKPSKGIGRRLIAALTDQIGGKSQYVSDKGTRFEMTFPLAEGE